MGKQETIGFILIAVVLIVWMYANAPTPPPPGSAGSDTTAVRAPDTTRVPVEMPPPVEKGAQADTLGRWFGHLAEGRESSLRVETDLYTAELTTKGALVRKFELKRYQTWDGRPVELIDEAHGGDLSYLITTSDGRIADTRDLYYALELPARSSVTLHGEDSASVRLILRIADGKRIERRFIFKNGMYSFDVETRFIGMEGIISNFEYEVVWSGGLELTEQNSTDEAEYAAAFTYIGGELEELDATEMGKEVSSDYTGSTSWVAARNKYFAVAMIPDGRPGSGAYLAGTRVQLPENGVKENYTIALKMPFKGREDTESRLTVFLGPLEYDIVHSYGVELDRIMSLGAAWIIRPISVYFIIPLFTFLHSFIPNYGLVIILFSVIIKVILHPLTRTSMRSMQRMQALQPMMNEIREKYKENPQKMNEATMRLYKDYGVNPVGGCLPMLLQLPILYALWSVFRSTIELRQAGFVLWIKDLSIPDVVANLGFSIPLLGSHISGLAFLMGATMFIQQKMSVKDPRQKMMVWMMPVILTLLFNNFPSGLNLYYFVFNLLSIAQQMWLNKQHKGDPLRKVEPKKRSGGLFSKMEKQMQLSKVGKHLRR